MSTPIPKSYSVRHLDAEYFDARHRGEIDPWGLLTAPGQRDKTRAIIQALDRPRYRHALELGCSIGAFTHRLSAVADAVTAMDTSSVALKRAREFCPASHVRFVHAHLPDGPLEGMYDLVVLADVLAYLTIPALVRFAERLSHHLAPSCHFVAVHTGVEVGCPLEGDRALELFRLLLRAERRSCERGRQRLLETWRMPTA